MNAAFRKFDLSGRTAVVTGGGTGLGYFMSRGLARSGARVLITARREEVLKEASARLNAEDGVAGEVTCHPVDLADRASIDGLVEHVHTTLGGADIFIGNAAQDFLEPFDQVQDSSMQTIWQVNFAANVQLLRAFLPRMRERGWGRAIFSSSTSTVCSPAREGMSMYTATKGALNSFTKTVAAETGHDGITVNTLVLGFYVTEIMIEAMAKLKQEHGQAAGDAFISSFTSMTALGRAGECEEIEGVVQLLASDAGSYITGTNLVVDGGLTIMLRPNP